MQSMSVATNRHPVHSHGLPGCVHLSLEYPKRNTSIEAGALLVGSMQIQYLDLL